MKILTPHIKRAAALALIAFALVSAWRAFSPHDDLCGMPHDDGYYAVLFRGGSLCPTCDVMQEAAERLFEAGRADGFTFAVVNYEEPGGERYIEQYDLYTSTIVLIERRDGEQARWKNLTESWGWAEKTGDLAENLEREMIEFRASAPRALES